MPLHLALLRGINVGGQKKVPMKELKTLLEEAGFERVQTYLQSGNVLFAHTETNSTLLAQQIEHLLFNHFGFSVSVIVKTPVELQAIVDQQPFNNLTSFPPDQPYVTFLNQAPTDENLQKANTFNFAPDEFMVLGTEVYLSCPNGYGQTKVTNNWLESKLKVTATTRNWKTVNELLKLVEKLWK